MSRSRSQGHHQVHRPRRGRATCGILQKQCIESAVALDLKRRSNKRPSPYPSAHRQKRSKLLAAQVSRTGYESPLVVIGTMTSAAGETTGEYQLVEKVDVSLGGVTAERDASAGHDDNGNTGPKPYPHPHPDEPRKTNRRVHRHRRAPPRHARCRPWPPLSANLWPHPPPRHQRQQYHDHPPSLAPTASTASSLTSTMPPARMLSVATALFPSVPGHSRS